MKLILTALLFALLISCGPITQEVKMCQELGTSLDITPLLAIISDTNSTVVIGNQTWMNKNLQSACFTNGDTIPLIFDTCAWKESDKAARTYFFNEKLEGFENVYGTYYNAAAITDKRGICPKGWRVPSISDWNELKSFIQSQERTDSISLFLADNPDFWPHGMRLNNKYKFNALATGFRGVYGGFQDQNKYAFWWVFPDSIGEQLRVFELASHDLRTYTMNTGAKAGFCVRCIKE